MNNSPKNYVSMIPKYPFIFIALLITAGMFIYSIVVSAGGSTSGEDLTSASWLYAAIIIGLIYGVVWVITAVVTAFLKAIKYKGAAPEGLFLSVANIVLLLVMLSYPTIYILSKI